MKPSKFFVILIMQTVHQLSMKNTVKGSSEVQENADYSPPPCRVKYGFNKNYRSCNRGFTRPKSVLLRIQYFIWFQLF